MSLGNKKGPHRFKPGQSGNPNGRPRAFRGYLRELLGQHGERGYDEVLKIAKGEVRLRKLVREPGPHEDATSVALIPMVEVQPSIRERLDAWQFLIEQLNGKSVSSLDVQVEGEVRHTVRDYSKLSDADLARFEQMLALAEGENVVDATPRELPQGHEIPAGHEVPQ